MCYYVLRGILDESSVGFSDQSTGGRKQKIYKLDKNNVLFQEDMDKANKGALIQKEQEKMLIYVIEK